MLIAQRSRDQAVVNRLEVMEEKWRQEELPKLQQLTRGSTSGSDEAIAIRLLHAKHSPETTEKDLLERVYGNISEGEV